jgi:hypothetical protein
MRCGSGVGEEAQAGESLVKLKVVTFKGSAVVLEIWQYQGKGKEKEEVTSGIQQTLGKKRGNAPSSHSMIAFARTASLARRSLGGPPRAGPVERAIQPQMSLDVDEEGGSRKARRADLPRALSEVRRLAD